MSNNNLFDNSEIIYSYSRAQALEDGELVDATEWASSAGRLNRWIHCAGSSYKSTFQYPRTCSKKGPEYLRGRAHDVLFMVSLAARAARQTDESLKAFSVLVTNRQGQKNKLDLFIDIGPGDEGEPVITIGFPEDF